MYFFGLGKAFPVTWDSTVRSASPSPVPHNADTGQQSGYVMRSLTASPVNSQQVGENANVIPVGT